MEHKKVSFEFDALAMSAKLKLDLNQDGQASLEVILHKEILEEILSAFKAIKE